MILKVAIFFYITVNLNPALGYSEENLREINPSLLNSGYDQPFLSNVKHVFFSRNEPIEMDGRVWELDNGKLRYNDFVITLPEGCKTQGDMNRILKLSSDCIEALIEKIEFLKEFGDLGGGANRRKGIVVVSPDGEDVFCNNQQSYQQVTDLLRKDIDCIRIVVE